MSRNPIALLYIVAACLAAADAQAQGAPRVVDETAKDIVATTVRSQGYPCEQPKRAVRDEAASAPDHAAWVIECANASYWVRYDNDVPAEIKRLD
jgi:hypothetical protein